MNKRESMAQVERVLVEHIGADSAAEAAKRWMSEFADKPGGGIVRFVQELSTRTPMQPTARQRLRMELFRALYEEAAPAGSIEEGADEGEAKPEPAAGPRSAGQQVCAVIIVSMLGQTASGAREQLLGEIKAHLRDGGGFEPSFVDAFGRWTGNGDPPVPTTDDGLQALVHAAYRGLCEVSGPASADRTLARCVQRAEGMAAAIEYPPQRLL